MTVTPAGPMYQIHSSERVFDGRIARVRVDQVRMPDGKLAAREVVDHDRAVAVVALDDDSHVVLIAQYRHPMGHRLWELPAGLMDVAGEGALLAAQRELAEETGLTADRWEVLVDVAASPGFTNEAVRVYLARGLKDVGRQGQITGEEADLQLLRVPLEDAVAAVLDGRIVNASAVAGLLAAHRLLATGDVGRPADDQWTTGPAVVSDPNPSPAVW